MGTVRCPQGSGSVRYFIDLSAYLSVVCRIQLAATENFQALGNKAMKQRSVVVKCLHGSFGATYYKRCDSRPALGTRVEL